MSTLINLLLKEMETEAATTRKMLSIVHADKFDWKPHPKSMSLKQLATHVAELPSWIKITLTTDELDFAKEPYNPINVENTAGLLDYFESNLAEARSLLEKAYEQAILTEMWTMRNAEVIYSTNTKYEVIRMTYSQIVHHRAQLGVFLRLLNVPIPGSYGPSADEMPLK
jgi:uncharacterized damage-inducible protein DinB